MPRSVALVTLGCARNEVDSEELAARLEAGGWELTEDAAAADTVLVNTCGFVEAAKRDSIDTLLAASDTGRPVVAVGCLAERYGGQLARELPEAAAVLGFDDYEQISDRLDDVLAGRPTALHEPRDRRTLLPLTPVERPASAVDVGIPGHAGGPRSVLRRRLADGPVAPLKLASGCDRRCSFCAIPSFRGAFVSRRPDEVLADAEWLAARGVRELVLVSENSSSYGKDLGDLRLLETLLPAARRGARDRSGPGVVPAARRGATLSRRGHDLDARRRGVLRPVVPARQRVGAPPDAAVRRPGAVRGAARRDP